MNCLGSRSHSDSNHESTKSRKLLRFSPKLRKRKSDKGAHGVAMATTNDVHVPNGIQESERMGKEKRRKSISKSSKAKM